jgi:hypothetical protein
VESFVEEIEFDIPGHTPLTEAEAAVKKEAAFKDLRNRSPGLSPTANPAKESPTFDRDAPHDFKQEYTYPITVVEHETVDDDAKPLSSAELVDRVARPRWALEGRDTESATWKTSEDRWEITVVSKTPVVPPPLGIWMQVGGQGVTATPVFQVIGSGLVELGSGHIGGLWQVQGGGVEDLHVRVEVLSVDAGSNGAVVRITLMTNDAEASVGGVTLTTMGSFQEVSLPATVRFGDATLILRRAKAFNVKLIAKRRFHVWRRHMREYSNAADYGDRPLVVPDLEDPRQFGTA